MSYTYNTLDQRTRVTYADASAMTDTLDALGRRTQKTDEASVSTDYAYDELGRLTTVTDAAGNTTSYTYDEAGNKLTQTDAEGRTTKWTYDSIGRVVSRALPLGQMETFSYDANGNRTGHTDFNGNTHTFAYDNNDRLTTETYADGSITSHVYDAEGIRTQSTINDNNGTRVWSYGYDNLNRLTQETKPDGSTLAYLYDVAGNKSQLITTLVDGTTESISYTYDALNRLATVTNSQGTSSYGYDAVGNRSSLSYPNGTSQTWTYDSRNRLTSTKIYNGSGALIQSFDYTLHPTGRRTQIKELNGRTSDYTYNSLYWLTSESIADTVNGNYSASYIYDKVGNRIEGTEAGVTTQYSYDANDRIGQQGGVTYTYDANGNTLDVNDQGVMTLYAYNSQNQMVENTAGGFITNYIYNADGIRHGQSDSVASTSYLVDANRSYAQVLAESVNGSLDVAYHYGDDLISQSRGVDSSYFHVDGLGSTRVLTDATGSQTDGYAYAAFGEVLSRDGVTDNSYLYTGEQLDSNLDQYYLRARYYDQGVGRFRSMDKFGGLQHDPSSLNKYLYGPSDPLNFNDPTGYFYGFSGLSAAQSIQNELIRMQATVNLVGISVIVSNARSLTTVESETKAQRASTKLAVGLAKMKVRQCQKSRTRKCNAGIPVIILGSDHFENTRHVRDSIETGHQYILNKTTRHNWSPSTKGPCIGKTKLGSGKECDEFPFGSTQQGGLQNYNQGRVSLRPISRTDNNSAGLRLKAFYKECEVENNHPTNGVFGVMTNLASTVTQSFCPEK